MCTFLAGGFSVSYIESKVETPDIWESHCHAQYEMIAVAEGDITIMMEGRSYRLTANQIAVLPPLLYHTITANKKGMYKRIIVQFDLTAIPPVLQVQFQKKGGKLAVFYSEQTLAMQRICREEDVTFYVPLVQSLLVQICYQKVLTKETETVCETDAFLQNIIEYVDNHLCEKITLSDLAKHTARSKSSVCHLFQQKMSISPKQYILQKKLAYADKLIRGGVPRTVAAIKVGYENYSNFYRMYKKEHTVGENG